MHHPQPCLIFGEVLFDHFPDGNRVLGGAPFNVAWHLQAFGLAPHFISRVGNDAQGQDILKRMQAWDMLIDGVQLDTVHRTGSVDITLTDGEPSYTIVPDCAYDFIDSHQLPKQSTTGILYHGSLAGRNPVSNTALQCLKQRHQGPIFMDVNLRAPWWQLAQLFQDLDHADWVKLNLHELLTLFPNHTDLSTAMLACYQQFKLTTLVVTLGANGAIAYNQQDAFISVKPPERIAVVDTVGAGDAFAAVLLLGIQQQWPLAITLERAQVFAGAMVRKRGATVADRDFYQAFCAEWA